MWNYYLKTVAYLRRISVPSWLGKIVQNSPFWCILKQLFKEICGVGTLQISLKSCFRMHQNALFWDWISKETSPCRGGRSLPRLSHFVRPVSEILHTPLSQNHTNFLYISVLSGSQPISTTSKHARSSVSMLSAVQLSSHHEPDDGSIQFSAVSCSSVLLEDIR